MEWLNYHHLRYFWTVAKAGSLKKAAEQLRVSQPAISAQIKELEDALGTPLFRRVGRANVLTDQVPPLNQKEIGCCNRRL